MHSRAPDGQGPQNQQGTNQEIEDPAKPTDAAKPADAAKPTDAALAEGSAKAPPENPGESEKAMPKTVQPAPSDATTTSTPKPQPAVKAPEAVPPKSSLRKVTK